MRFLLLLFLIFSLSSFDAPAASQDTLNIQWQELKLDTLPAPSPLIFEEGKLESYKEYPQFNYSETPPDNWWTRFKRYINLQYHRLLDWLFGEYTANSFVLFLIRLLPYLVLLGVLILAVWIFNRMNPAAFILGEPKEGEVFFSEDEEIIRSQDIGALIEKAIAEEDYRLAIRYSFLMVLQRMSENGLIDYGFSKTDTDYFSELKNPALQQQFRKLSRIYDYVWYGNFEASLSHLEQSKKEMDLMLDLIQKNDE